MMTMVVMTWKKVKNKQNENQNQTKKLFLQSDHEHAKGEV